MKRSPSSRLWWLTYPLWLVLCLVLFIAMRGMDDPSRPNHRLESDEAAILAIQHLREALPGRFDDYEVVHVARASVDGKEGERRWMIVADRRDRTRLHEAVLIELELVDGALLDVRRIDPETATYGPSILQRSSEAAR